MFVGGGKREEGREREEGTEGKREGRVREREGIRERARDREKEGRQEREGGGRDRNQRGIQHTHTHMCTDPLPLSIQVLLTYMQRLNSHQSIARQQNEM